MPEEQLVSEMKNRPDGLSKRFSFHQSRIFQKSQQKIPIPSFFTLLDGLIPLISEKQLDKQVRKIAAVTVAEAMTPNPVTVQPDTNIEEVAALMVERNFHTIPVVDEGELVGIVGKEDILRTLIPISEAE